VEAEGDTNDTNEECDCKSGMSADQSRHLTEVVASAAGNQSLIITRPDDARQLTFGAGYHSCLGSSVARATMGEVALLARTARRDQAVRATRGRSVIV
jgi:hypothetical protein